MDGKSIMGILLLAAAARDDDHDRRRRPRRAGSAGRTLSAGRKRIWRRVVERLIGIGVSPGVAVGRAVILTLRTEAIRFPIPADRVDREIAALHAAREQSRQQLRTSAIASPRPAAPSSAPIFDAQILMLDDALFVGRAEEIIRAGAGQRRVGGASRLRRARRIFASVEDEYLRERENDVADVAGRAADEPAARRARCARAAERARRAVDPDRRRADGVAGGATRLDAHPGIRRRRRQPHVSHRDPRALAEGAGGRRPARRVGADPRRHAGHPRRHDRRARGQSRRRMRSTGRTASAARPRGRAPLVSLTPRRRARRSPPPTASASGCRQTSSCSRISSCCASTAPKASGCTARSSCCRAARSKRPPRRRSTRSTAA